MTEPPALGHSSSPAPANGKQIVALVIFWAIVGVPAGWGVAQTVRKSVPLFTAPAAIHAAPNPAPAGTAR